MRALLFVLLCAAARAGTEVPAAAPPTLNLDFVADMQFVYTQGTHIAQEMSVKLAYKASSYLFAMTQYSPQYDKTFTQINLCSQGRYILLEPFFNRTVCDDVAEVPAPSADSCFAAILNGGFIFMYEYSQSEYIGQADLNGTLAEHYRYTDGQQGIQYNFYLDVKGGEGTLLLQSLLLGNEKQTFTFSSLVSPAPASEFQAPPGVTCPAVTAEMHPQHFGHGFVFNVLEAAKKEKWLATKVDDTLPAVREALKKEGSLWEAGPVQWPFPGATFADVANTLKTHAPFSSFSSVPIRYATNNTSITKGVTNLPTSFDARQQWPQCHSIGTVRNQGDCGACWAFGSVEAFEDRNCIQYGHDETLSPQYLVDCDTFESGCDGGFLDNAWWALMRIGVTTESCVPYQHCDYTPFPNCTAPHGNTGHAAPAGVCPTSCADKKTFTRVRATSAYAAGGWENVTAIQLEIMTNGPIEVGFMVYSDFMTYRSGVYRHTAAGQGPLGGHAVKVIGWGEEQGVPYWLAVNSWSPLWGENGLFKIIRGQNEVGIELTPAAGRL